MWIFSTRKDITTNCPEPSEGTLGNLPIALVQKWFLVETWLLSLHPEYSITPCENSQSHCEGPCHLSPVGFTVNVSLLVEDRAAQTLSKSLNLTLCLWTQEFPHPHMQLWEPLPWAIIKYLRSRIILFTYLVLFACTSSLSVFLAQSKCSINMLNYKVNCWCVLSFFNKDFQPVCHRNI